MHLSSVIVSVLSCVIIGITPILLNSDFDSLEVDDQGSEIPLQKSISSLEHKISMVATIACFFPILMELTIDSFQFSKSRRPIKSFVALWSLVLVILIPNTVILFNINTFMENYKYYPFIHNFRGVIAAISLISIMSEYGAPIWTKRNTDIIVLLFVIASNIDGISAFYALKSFWGFFALSLYFLSSCIVFWLTYTWVRHISSRPRPIILTFEEYCCNIHLLAFYLSFICFWIIYGVLGNATWACVGPAFLAGGNYGITTIAVIVVVLEGRITRGALVIEQTERALDIKSSFIRYISHEVRTPLNVVSMGLKCLYKELHQSESCHPEWIDIVSDAEQSVEMAVDILNNFLTYESLSGNVLELYKEILPMKKFLEESMRPFFLLAREKEVQLILDMDFGSNVNAGCILIKADKNKLIQVLRNLVTNAIKYSESDNVVTIRVRTTHTATTTNTTNTTGINASTSIDSSSIKSTELLSQKGNIGNRGVFGFRIRRGSVISENVCTNEDIPNTLHIEVIDHGQGISKENQNRIFKDIVKFNPGELQDGKGSGLGLWISHGIISLHEGHLSLYSKGLGHGCTFTIDIPLYHNPAVNNGVLASFEEEEPESVPVRMLHGINTNTNTISRENSSTDNHDYQQRDVHGNNDKRVIPAHLPHLPSTSTSTSPRRLSTGLGRTTNETWSKYAKVGDFNTPSQCYDAARGMGQDNAINTTTTTTTTVQGFDSLQEERVLIVDDVAMNRKMTRRLLRDMWTDMTEASDGLEAVRSVEAAITNKMEFDVILMDFEMPNMDGPTATSHIRRLLGDRRCHIIGVTGNALPQDVQHFLSQGADRVLIKPLRLTELKKTLQELQAE